MLVWLTQYNSDTRYQDSKFESAAPNPIGVDAQICSRGRRAWPVRVLTWMFSHVMRLKFPVSQTGRRYLK